MTYLVSALSAIVALIIFWGAVPKINAPNIIWRYSSAASITAPVVAEGRIFSAGVGARQEGVVYALDSTTGKVLWQYNKLGAVLSSPSIGYYLYAGGEDGYLYAFNPKNGVVMWRFKTAAPLRTSPTVIGQTVIAAGGDRMLYAIDAKSGKEKWRFEARSFFLAAPAADTATVYAAGNDHYLYAIDLKTGKLRWKFESAKSLGSVPAVSGNLLYVYGFDKRLYALRTQDGKKLWEKDIRRYISAPSIATDAPPLVTADKLVLSVFSDDSSMVIAYDKLTGAEHWRFLSKSWLSAPVVIDSTIYVGAWVGKSSALLSIDSQNGTEVNRLALDGRLITSPVIAGNRLYIGAGHHPDHYLYCISP